MIEESVNNSVCVFLSAAPGEPESRRQDGVLSLEHYVDVMGGGCERSDVGLLRKITNRVEEDKCYIPNTHH